jgi:predicted RNA-binding Zn-ribbon protein involved in translation (DUF1610 family)
MEKKSERPCVPDKKLAAVCGLFCPSCTAYIGAHEDPKRLEGLAARTGQPLEKLQCNGCRSDKRSYYCESLCTMYKCAAAKEIDFCGQCAEYPCEELKAFQAAMPHRLELWKSQERIKEAGYEKWFEEMVEHYSCPACGTINSTYDMVCRKCGAAPSCAYVDQHKEEIIRQMASKK